MQYTKRFEYYLKKLYFNYKIKWYAQPNPYDEGRYWEHEDIWFVFCGLNNKCFEWELDNYYDGHRISYVSFLWIIFGWGYSYQSERLI